MGWRHTVMMALAFALAPVLLAPTAAQAQSNSKQAVEAARAMEEGVLLAPADGDVGAVLGVGFPAYTGGPFCYIDGIGLPAFVFEADRLATLFGEHLRPPQLLRDMAANGQTFYGRNARS